eukprot:UN34440
MTETAQNFLKNESSDDSSDDEQNTNQPTNEKIQKDNDDNSNLETSTQVYVSGIPYEATENDLKKFFKVCGKVEKVVYPKLDNKSRPKGYAFIHFSSEAQAAEAIEINGAQLMGRKLLIKYSSKGRLTKKPADCKIIFISNLNFKTSEEDVERFFSDCGDIIEVRLPSNKKGYKHGIGYVEFTNTESVDKAIKKDGETLGERPITVNWALPNKTGKIHKRLQESHTLFVGNLPMNFSVDRFETFLSERGVNTSDCRIRLQKRPNGSFKGHLFVDFDNINDSLKILNENGKQYFGRKLLINISLNKLEQRGIKRKFDGDGNDPDGDNSSNGKRRKIDTHISRDKKKCSLIIHGMPRSVLYEEIQKKIRAFEPEKFCRYKASLVVVFKNRLKMGQCCQKFNCQLEFNGKILKWFR